MRKRFVFNNEGLKEVRIGLRRNSTKAEKIIWKYIRNNKLGVKFYRQYSVGPFVIDFYCPKKKLAVEIDGKWHREEPRFIYDKNRSEFLNAHGLIVVRFFNDEVLNNLEAVLDKIRNLV